MRGVSSCASEASVSSLKARELHVNSPMRKCCSRKENSLMWGFTFCCLALVWANISACTPAPYLFEMLCCHKAQAAAYWFLGNAGNRQRSCKFWKACASQRCRLSTDGTSTAMRGVWWQLRGIQWSLHLCDEVGYLKVSPMNHDSSYCWGMGLDELPSLNLQNKRLEQEIKGFIFDRHVHGPATELFLKPPIVNVVSCWILFGHFMFCIHSATLVLYSTVRAGTLSHTSF